MTDIGLKLMILIYIAKTVYVPIYLTTFINFCTQIS